MTVQSKIQNPKSKIVLIPPNVLARADRVISVSFKIGFLKEPVSRTVSFTNGLRFVAAVEFAKKRCSSLKLLSLSRPAWLWC